MKWLLLGAGDISKKRVLPALAAEPRSEVAAVCDLDENRAKELASECDADVFTDYGAALSDSGADAVYVATPVFLHVAHAIRALGAEKHVLVEKPVGVNYEQAAKLASAAEKSPGKCGVSYFRRFTSKYKMAKEMLAKGEFGQVVLIRMTYFSWFNPAKNDPKYWRVVPKQSGGGPLSDMGTHMFDVLIGLFGVPEKVYARVATLTHDYSVEDSATAVMTLSGGAQVIASFNWNSKTWSHEFEIVGTEAKVKWHPYDSGSVVTTVGRDIREIDAPNHENVHYPLIEDFVSAVEEDRDPAITAAEAAKTNLLLDAVYLSARQNREVQPSEIGPPET